MEEFFDEEQLQKISLVLTDIFTSFDDFGQQLEIFMEMYEFLQVIDFRNNEHLDRLYEYFPEEITKSEIEKIKQIMEEDDYQAIETEQYLKEAFLQVLASGEELYKALNQKVLDLDEDGSLKRELKKLDK